MHTTDWLSFAFSFALVLALLGVLLYTLKKMQNGGLPGMTQRRMRVLDSMSMAPRQKLVLIRVKGQDILLGVTAQQINTLASFPLSDDELDADGAPADGTAQTSVETPLAPLARRFAELLKSAQNKDKA